MAIRAGAKVELRGCPAAPIREDDSYDWQHEEALTGTYEVADLVTDNYGTSMFIVDTEEDLEWAVNMDRYDGRVTEVRAAP